MKRYKRQHRLDRGMRGWIVNCAKKNLWRVPQWYDLDDLIQEGLLLYCKLNIRYAHVTEPAHFMALLKISFITHIHSLSVVATNTPDRVITAFDRSQYADVDDVLESAMTPEPETATVCLLVKQLPKELAQLLTTLLNDGRNLPIQKFADGTRETQNEYLTRIGNFPPGTDVAKLFYDHFLDSNNAL